MVLILLRGELIFNLRVKEFKIVMIYESDALRNETDFIIFCQCSLKKS